MSDSPTTRSLKILRKRGYLAAVVEKWNSHVGIRQDLFGIIDVIGVSEDGTIAVQACAYSSVSKRVDKITASEATPILRKAGWKIVVMGWHKVKNRYVMREVDLS